MGINQIDFTINMTKFVEEAVQQKNRRPFSLPALTNTFNTLKNYLNKNNIFYLFHSEQWLLQWLERENGSTFASWIDNIIKEENKERGALEGLVKQSGALKTGWTLENVILHVHSSRDPCDLCAASLSIIAGVDDLNFKKALRKLICGLYPKVVYREEVAYLFG